MGVIQILLAKGLVKWPLAIIILFGDRIVFMANGDNAYPFGQMISIIADGDNNNNNRFGHWVIIIANGNNTNPADQWISIIAIVNNNNNPFWPLG